MHSGLAIGVKLDVEQPMFLHAFPAAAAAADRDIGVAAAQVAQLVAGRHPDCEVGMLHLERAQPPREPGVGESMRGGDRQQRFVFLAMAGECRLDRVEGAGQWRQQALPKRGQPSAPFSRTNNGDPSRSSRLLTW